MVLIGIILWHAAACLLALAAYGIDKRRAIRNTRRTPERTLHTLALLGGWPGALLAMRLFKHKRRKAAFTRVFWLTAAAHGAALCGIIYLFSRA